MIRQHFGLTRDPFIIDHKAPLLTHQQRHFDILKVHSQQGGFCLILGEPGTGKTVLKHHIIHHDTKHWITPVINRSLHSWHNILRLLCQAFELESDGTRFMSEGLDSDYVGGKAFLGWDGCLMGRRSKLDFAVGYFDLDVDYTFTGSAALPGSLTDQLADYATTVETDFTTYFKMMGFDSSLTIGVMYISEMAQIVHDPAAVASLTTDDAVLISGMVQIAL